MKRPNRRPILFLFALALLPLKPIFAAEGDTTRIRVHDAVHMNWWGAYNVWGVFPSAATSFRRINLDFTIGCPPSGCSDWDYTVQVEALHKTGTYDSTLQQAPLWTVVNLNGSTTVPDTVFANQYPVYITFYDSTTASMDSLVADSFYVYEHGNPNDPLQVTDSLIAYPARFYNYVFGANGVITDSVFVGASWIFPNSYTPYYALFEIVERIELARVITPYGGYYSNTWSNTVHFDITDLAPILHDSVEIRAFYGGWSDGFALTLDFEFIEGTPPRTAVDVRNIYSSGPGGFPYGNANDPIENYLVAKTFPIALNETNARLRIIPTGHGEGTQDCAEFCPKNYRLLIDGVQQFQKAIWRDDCGLNHLLHQAGTWLYDRANWCPGEKGLVHEFEITPFITPGNPVTIDMDIDAFTNTMSGQNPNYIMAAQLITFGNPNFSTDASMEAIIAPNNDFYYNRFNPICNNPLVEIRNTGANPLTSVTITYGIEGATPTTYNWTGNLLFNQSEQVQLGNIDWSSTTNSPDQFYAYVSDPNGTADAYAYNDTMHTRVDFPPQHPSTFVLLFKTNLAFNETTWNIRDDQGNTLFTNGILAANTIYRDTLTLAPGCYTFNMEDSDKDGLNFFANSDGTGYARFVNAFGPGVLQFIDADFGTRISQQFTVGYLLHAPIVEPVARMNVFPNPVSGVLTIDLAMPTRQSGLIEISDISGKHVWSSPFSNTDNPVITTDLHALPAGIYSVSVVSSDTRITRRIVLMPQP